MDPDDCPRVTDAGLTGPIGGTLERTPTIIDPDDCPEITDLWFELVDAGYTEDEAFDLVEMVMGEGLVATDPTGHEDIVDKDTANIPNYIMDYGNQDLWK